jgi:hypothetical protein
MYYQLALKSIQMLNCRTLPGAEASGRALDAFLADA